MTLYINTTQNHTIEVVIKNGKRIVAKRKINAPHKQAKKLLPLIDGLIKKAGIKFGAIKKIQVANKGGSFTALRVGVATANALAYALGVPVEGSDKSKKYRFNIIKPIYDKEPNITMKSHNS